MLTRLLAVAHLTTLAIGVVKCLVGDSGVGVLLLCVGVLMLIILRVNEVIDIGG